MDLYEYNWFLWRSIFILLAFEDKGINFCKHIFTLITCNIWLYKTWFFVFFRHFPSFLRLGNISSPNYNFLEIIAKTWKKWKCSSKAVITFKDHSTFWQNFLAFKTPVLFCFKFYFHIVLDHPLITKYCSLNLKFLLFSQQYSARCLSWLDFWPDVFKVCYCHTVTVFCVDEWMCQLLLCLVSSCGF